MEDFAYGQGKPNQQSAQARNPRLKSIKSESARSMQAMKSYRSDSPVLSDKTSRISQFRAKTFQTQYPEASPMVEDDPPTT